jgi:hypothetical protein
MPLPTGPGPARSIDRGRGRQASTAFSSSLPVSSTGEACDSLHRRERLETVPYTQEGGVEGDAQVFFWEPLNEDT